MYPIATLLPKILKWVEVIALTITVLGVLFKIMHYAGANEMLMIGLLTLSSAYFLSGFVMVEPPQAEDGKLKGFLDLLPTILRKIMFIGLSVFCVGYLFRLLHFQGANEMLIIGIGTLIMSSLISMALILGNRERAELLKAPLIRSIFVIALFGVSLLR